MAYTEDQVSQWLASNPTAGIDELTTALANGLPPLAQPSPPPPQYESAPQRDIVETNRETSNGTAPIFKTAAEVYQSVLGRAPENKEVEKAWDDYFGGNVDVSKLQGFLRAATPELQSTGYKPATEGFNASAYMAANKDVADAYAVDNYGLTPEQFAAEHYQIFGAKEGRQADPSAQYDKIVKDTYATEMGLDPNTIDANNEGLKYWKNQLVTGAVNPKDFNSVFENAARDYVKSHPSDVASTYFQNYQLGQQKDTIKSTFSDILKDKSVSLDEANTIQAYEDKYNFTPEQIASVTGYSVDAIKEILNSKQSIIKNVVKSNVSNPLGLSDFATQNGLTAKQLADASGGAYTEAQVQANLDLAKTFQGRLQLASPDAYNQIKGLTQYTANENFGGKTQDYQVQLFTPLDITKTGIPTQLEFTPVVTKTAYNEDGNPYTYQSGGAPKTSGVEMNEDGTFSSNKPTYVNGVPVFAQYDTNGKVVSYSGDPRVVTWLDGGHYVYGSWDAQGNAKPKQVATSGGGFIKNMASDIASSLKDLGPAWTVAKLFNPELALVDVATDIGQGKFNLGTAVNAVSGYGGLQTASATDMLNPSSANYVNTIDQGYNVAQVPNINVSNPVTGALANASTAKLVASSLVAIDAADKGNYAPILNVVANVSGANKMPEVAIAANTLAAVDAINKNSPGALMTAAGNLVNSPDLKVAGAATKFIQAYNSGNQAAITTSGAELFSSINANVPGASTTLKNLVSDATSAINPTTTTTAPLSTGSTITYDKDGNPTSTPSGTNVSSTAPLSDLTLASNNSGVVSDAGNGLGGTTPTLPQVRGLSLQEGSKATKNEDGSYSVEWTNPNNPDDKRGYELSFDENGLPTYSMSNLSQESGATGGSSVLTTTKMPQFDPNVDPKEGGGLGSPTKVKPVSSTENPDGTVTQVMSDGKTRIVDGNTGKVISDSSSGNDITVGPLTSSGGTTGGNSGAITGGLSGVSGGTGTGGTGTGGTGTGGTGTGGVDTGSVSVTTPLTSVITPPTTTVTTPITTTTSPLTSVTTNTSYVPPKEITQTAPLSLTSTEVPTLESDPRGLTSKNKKDKKILKELEMLFGTLTPELVSALQDRGIYVPQELAMKDESAKEAPKETPKEAPKEETAKKTSKNEEETPKEILDNKALETKFVATGGTVNSNIDTMNSILSSSTPKASGANLISAAPLLDIPSRLGALKQIRASITGHAIGGLARGSLPQKYAEATPEGHKPEFITGLTGYYASGKGTGQSDDIDAMLHDGDYVADADLVAALGDGSSKAGAEALEKFRRQVPHQHSVGGQPVPAKIADGEYVFPSSFVTAIGKGDNKEGARILDKMREAIRAHKRSAPTSKIPPKAKSPLDYLKMVKG